MNLVVDKERSPLGTLYFQKKEWERLKLRRSVMSLRGVKESHWRAWLNYKPAYEIPGDVQEIFIRELPESAPLFKRPQL